ncbi:MAG: hypothetical protein IT360_09740 [Gemmatimonadaceae bacterium]|nr:hypothetical protein [Gemmatimonadaceae bacterium]
MSAVAIFLTAVALQRACTLAWGRTSATDTVRYELSVVGLSRLSGMDNTARTDCRWWPRYGDAALCGPSTTAAPAHRTLRFAYPMLQVAMWLAVVSLLLQALRVPRPPPLQALVPATTAALVILAIVYVDRGARVGLAALEGLPMAFDAAGYRFAVAAAVLSAGSALLLLLSFSRDQPSGADVDA